MCACYGGEILFKDDDIHKHRRSQHKILSQPLDEETQFEESLQTEVVRNLMRRTTKAQFITLLRKRGIQDGTARSRRYLAIWEKYAGAV
jgi:hypothetical protein